MLVLCKTLLNVLCLWPTTVPPAISSLRYFVKLSIELITLSGSYLYVLEILHDIDAATEPGFVCFAFATTIFIYTWLILRKRSIEHSLELLESYIDESKNECYIKSICTKYVYFDIFITNFVTFIPK